MNGILLGTVLNEKRSISNTNIEFVVVNLRKSRHL